MRVSASKLGMLRACQWFARPEVKWQRDDPGPAAQLGTTTHELIAATVEGRKMSVADDRATSMAASALEWLTGRWEGAEWIAEPAYVLDTATGAARLHGRNIGRNYPRLAEPELAGSADLVMAGDAAVLIDFKTGRRENVEPVESNQQMLTLALAAARAHGARTVRAVLAFVGPSGVTTDEAVFDALDLDAHAAELRATVAAIPTSEPKPGKHCQYCPARAVCPAMGTALATVTPRTRLPIVQRSEDFVSPEHVAEQYLTLRAAKVAIEQAWGAIRSYVDTHGAVDLGNGHTYARRETKRESISLDSRVAVDALRDALGPSWETAVSLSTTKTDIEAASREVAKVSGEKIVAVKNRTLDALRAVGAISTNISNTYEEA